VSLWFHPAAQIEHLDHVAYYESRQKGLGSGYLFEFEKMLAAMSEGLIDTPPIGHGRIRRAHLRRFPITVLFRESGHELQILAVAHKRRRPTYWNTRL
jgi:toxin ParE1/3/4